MIFIVSLWEEELYSNHTPEKPLNMTATKYSLSDVPLEQSTNDFGTEGYVEGLENFIIHAATPITIALQGEWGSGKTSLMNRLFIDLCGKDKEFIGITVNTWEYSMLATPEETVLKIIGRLVHSLTEKDDKAKSKAARFMRGALGMAFRAGRDFAKGLFPGAGYIIEGLGTAADLPESNNDDTPVSLSELKKILSDTIAKTKKETNKKGILIFVDDLDRLNPPLAVQILELLKNIFTLADCIFVLAIDYDVVVKGLEPKFGKLSDTNEREFRSFFDKIIQVPFSLPVNNYKPMNFVLNSLVSIGYITPAEREIPYISANIEKIVVSSVGKNPRSIKRLINTLSLLDCIGKCALNKKDDSLESKIISFAIVAIQVCYPKIYDILTVNPMFSQWGESVASKLNLHLKPHDGIDGKDILDALCEKDVYLSKHHKEILTLLDIIYEGASAVNSSDPEEIIREILDRSSITNVSATLESAELDRKALISRLHENIRAYLEKEVPEITISRFKNNTGNGGLVILLSDGRTFEVCFSPRPKTRNINGRTENQVALGISLGVWNSRPAKYDGVPYRQVIADPEIREIIRPLDDAVVRLSKYGIIEGRTFGENIIFHNVFDEYASDFREGSLWNAISGSVDYWINRRASDFEDKRIIEAIGTLIIAAREMNERAIRYLQSNI